MSNLLYVHVVKLTLPILELSQNLYSLLVYAKMNASEKLKEQRMPNKTQKLTDGWRWERGIVKEGRIPER